MSAVNAGRSSAGGTSPVLVAAEPVAKLGDAYLLEPECPLELGATPFVQGEAPAVRTSEDTLDRAKRRACLTLWNALLDARWVSQQHPSLNPYHAAHQLNEGWPEFRRQVSNDLANLRSLNPGFISQVNVDRTANALWRILRARVRDYIIRMTGRDMTIRQVMEFFEKYWIPPRPRVDPEKAVWEFTETGQGAGGVDCFRSSGLKREGTIHEIIEDLENPAAREYEHRLAEESTAQIRKAQSEGRTRSF